MLKEGDRIPDVTFVMMGNDGPESISAQDVFSGRNVALFGLPGAYTPVCHKEHLPGIVALYDTFMEAGMDVVACTAVNDIFVLDKWASDLGATDKVTMLADGNVDFAMNSGLAVDMRKYGLGIRSNRYAMLASDGIVSVLSVEEAFMDHKVSSAASLYGQIDAVPAQARV